MRYLTAIQPSTGIIKLGMLVRFQITQSPSSPKERLCNWVNRDYKDMKSWQSSWSSSQWAGSSLLDRIVRGLYFWINNFGNSIGQLCPLSSHQCGQKIENKHKWSKKWNSKSNKNGWKVKVNKLCNAPVWKVLHDYIEMVLVFSNSENAV